MKHSHTLITAFAGTSAETVTSGLPDVLLLPSNREKDTELLIRALKNGRYNRVISLGQKPVIRNKVYIETTARQGDKIYQTDFDCLRLKSFLAGQGIAVKISHNAGTSFCNSLYFGGLEFIYEKMPDTKMVFLHIPFEKNIDGPDNFRNAIAKAIKEAV